MTAVLVEDDGPVRVITLSQPERRNALGLEARVALLAALTDRPSEVRAAVLTGGSFFCAGGDITTMTSDDVVGRQRLDAINAVVRSMVAGDVPVVSAVEGGAYGLGFGLAMASDFVVAGASAKFAASFGRIGLGPDSGLSYTLPLRVGAARTRELLLTGRALSAAEAAALHVVDDVVPDGAALGAAVDRARQLAALSAPMLKAVRSLVHEPDRSFEGCLASESSRQLRLWKTPEFAEGRAAFLERRPPDFHALAAPS